MNEAIKILEERLEKYKNLKEIQEKPVPENGFYTDNYGLIKVEHGIYLIESLINEIKK